MVKLLTESVQSGVIEHFKEVAERKKFGANDVEKGRTFIKAYVEFIHYVERIYDAVKNPAQGHFPESEGGAVHK